MEAIKVKDIDFPLEDEFFFNYSSSYTRNSYKSDIVKFISWLNDYCPEVKTFQDVNRLEVIQYRNYLAEFGSDGKGPAAPKTISRKLSALSSYYDYLIEKNFLSVNPVNSVKHPRREVITPTKALNVEQVRELLDCAKNNKNSGPMHFALLNTFFYTGLRKSEILQLKFNDYKSFNGKRILNFKGKGGKLGQKLLHPNCIQAIEDYLDWMRSRERELTEEDYLFQPTKNPSNPKHLNKSLNPKTINEIIDSYAKKIHLDFKISPHSARATFISALLEQGVDIYSVAQEVRHSSVTTTQEYDKRRRSLDDSPNLKLKI